MDDDTEDKHPYSTPPQQKLARNTKSIRSNVSGISELANKVLVQHLASVNPQALKLEQVVRNNPNIFSDYNYEKVRNRYNYLLSLRQKKPADFLELCSKFSVVPTKAAIEAILTYNFGSPA
jgi:hypothetical protein